MVLYIIGLGLGDEKDITVRGLEAVRGSAKVVLEHYTSILGVDKAKLVGGTLLHLHVCCAEVCFAVLLRESVNVYEVVVPLVLAQSDRKCIWHASSGGTSQSRYRLAYICS